MTDFVIVLVGGGARDNCKFVGNPKAVVRLTDDSNSGALGIPDDWPVEPQCTFNRRARTLIVVTNTPILIYLRNGIGDTPGTSGVATPIPVAAGGLSSYSVETQPGNDGLFICRDV